MAAQTLVYDRSSNTEELLGNPNPGILTALICDNPLLRTGLGHILQDTPFALNVPGIGTGPFQHVAPEPALILIDGHQATGRLLEIIRQVREHLPEVRIVAVADQFDPSFVRSGHKAGLNGFCSAAGAPEVLIKTLELVMLGETVLPFEALRTFMGVAPQNQEPPLQGRMAEPELPDLKGCKLSAREREILGCLTQGEPNKVIARKLEVSEATIKVHVKSILRKIGATNRTQAAMWASQRLPGSGVTTLNV